MPRTECHLPDLKGGRAINVQSEIFHSTKLSIKRLIELVNIADAKARGVDGHVGDSRALRDLEEAFNCRLRDTTKKTLTFTPAGHELVRLARSFLSALDGFHKQCQNQSTHLTVAAGDSLLHLILLPRLVELQGQLHNIVFNVEDMRTNELITGLRERQIDFAILQADALRSLQGIQQRPIGTYSYGVFWSKNLGERHESSPENFAQIPFALIRQHWGHDFSEMLGNPVAGLNLRVRCETFTQVMRLVRLGDFAGVLPWFGESFFPSPDYVRVRLDIAGKKEFQIVLACNKSMLQIKPEMLHAFDVLAAKLKF